jgi:hypothetical protein
MKKHDCDQDFKTPRIFFIFFFIRSGGGRVGKYPTNPPPPCPFSLRKTQIWVVFSVTRTGRVRLRVVFLKNLGTDHGHP